VLVACPVPNRPTGAPRFSGGLKIKVFRGSSAFRIYKKTEVDENFRCNYELNPVYREAIESSGLKVSGESEDGGARIVELPNHRFFMGTGFLPQFNSEKSRPHPLLLAFIALRWISRRQPHDKTANYVRPNTAHNRRQSKPGW